MQVPRLFYVYWSTKMATIVRQKSARYDATIYQIPWTLRN